MRRLAGAGLGLRRLIDDTVVALVSPSLPINSQGLTCTEALVEIQRSGYWTINIHLEATSPAPVVFVAGFITARGYFGGLIGALNFDGGPSNTSTPGGVGSFSIRGYSRWIEENYHDAATEGVNIRVHSSTDVHGQIRALVQEWARTLGRPLYRPLSLLDTDYSDRDAWGVPDMTGGSLLDEVGEGGGLSFEVSLRFE